MAPVQIARNYLTCHYPAATESKLEHKAGRSRHLFGSPSASKAPHTQVLQLEPTRYTISVRAHGGARGNKTFLKGCSLLSSNPTLNLHSMLNSRSSFNSPINVRH